MPFDNGFPESSAAFYFFFVVVATGVVTVIGMAVASSVGQWRQNRDAPLRRYQGFTRERAVDGTHGRGDDTHPPEPPRPA